MVYDRSLVMETTTDSSIDLQKLIQQLSEENRIKNLEIEYLKEHIKLLAAQLYRKKSEKFDYASFPGQLNFLEDLPEESVLEEPNKTIEVPAHTRKKSGRKPLPENLEREEVVHDIPEEDKECACGTSMEVIGQEISEQLDYTPPELKVTRHIRPKYACKNCEGIETEGSTIKIAPPPQQIIPKSIASAGLLAQIVTAKFVDSMPFYRQEKQFGRLGYEISRTNMANWVIQLGTILEKLLGLLKQELLSGPLINMDETTIQVLKESGRDPTTKSYMWVLRGGAPDHPGVFFEYNPRRSARVAQGLLESYHGIVQTDGYAGYNFIEQDPHMKQAGCWAHARRKFVAVLKAAGKYDKKKAKMGHATQAVDTIGQLYDIERYAETKKLSDQQVIELRQNKSKPILDEFHQRRKDLENKTPPKGLLGKAIAYCLERWKQLTLYCDYGFVTIDNNPAENAIRPFVVGRKNGLFCDTVPGAVASARLYSLVETAKANKLNVYKYFKRLFEKLPCVETDQHLKELLPQYIKHSSPEIIDKERTN